MADRNALVAVRPVWMKQAEEAKLKSEAEKTAAAKAAFDATFKDVDMSKPKIMAADSSDDEDGDYLADKPIGPVDPAKCTAAGAGVSGGAAGSPTSFVLTTKDSDERKIPNGGAHVKVNVTPGVGVGGSDIEGVVKDQSDGTYSVTYVVPKRGNYMVNVECNGYAIMGSPFPVFFSTGGANGGLLGVAPTTSSYPNLVNANMPNMPNYAGSVSGSLPGLGGMIPGLTTGPSGGVLLPGIGVSLGEICREFLNGRCFKTDCKLSHPVHNLLMTAIAATSSMGAVNQVPLGPSAAAMAAAQAIMAAQALQAHAAQQAQSQSSKGASEKDKADMLKRTIQVSNLIPVITADQLKQIFGAWGTVVDCIITDSKNFAFIEYSKPGEATVSLAANNLDLGGRPLNVEMAKSLPPKPATSGASSSLPMMMQQAVAMQQLQFQQALLMQQTMNAQQAANRAATLKSATDLASARAAEITKKMKDEGFTIEENESLRKSRSPQPSKVKSRSISRSPTDKRHKSRSYSPMRRYRGLRSKSPRKLRRRSRSLSPKGRHSRHHRSRSPLVTRHYPSYDRRSYRDASDRFRRRDSYSARDYHVSASRRHISRSPSPRGRKSYRDRSDSPKYRRRRSSKHLSKSPERRRGGRSSPANDAERKPKQRHRSSSKSVEDRLKSSKRTEEDGEKISHHGRRRSRSLSCENKPQSGGKLTPVSSDDNTQTRRKRSKSRSLEAKYHPDDRLDDSKRRKRSCSRSADAETRRKRSRSRSADAETRRKRSRSRSADAETRRRDSNEICKSRDVRRPRSKSVDVDRKEGTRKRSRSRSKDKKARRRVSNDKHKSRNGRRSRSKSVEDVRKDEYRKEKQKRRERRRSRSVSEEPSFYSGGKSSGHRDVESKHRRASRSISPKVKIHKKDDGIGIRKPNCDDSRKDENDAESDGSPSLNPMVDQNEFSKSDIASELPTSIPAFCSENISGNPNIVDVPKSSKPEGSDD